MKNNENIWLMEPEHLKNFLEKTANATPEEIEAADVRFGREPQKESILAINGAEAEISIVGALSPSGPSPIAKYFGFKGTAYSDIVSAVRDAADNPSVKTIKLLMNTPGGTVLGVDQTWQAIKDAASKKVVIAENHGMIFSAGYWLASATTKIVSDSPVNMTGSIGVVFATYDWTQFESKLGVKRVVIVSQNAPDKVPDITKDEGRDVIREELNAIERVFIERISKGRSLSAEFIAENFGKGGILIAQDPGKEKPDAISVKMIDGLKTDVSVEHDDSILADAGVVGVDTAGADSQANNVTEGEKVMKDLDAVVAEHPHIGIELKARDKSNRDIGQQASTDSFKEKVEKVKAYFSADSKYPNTVRESALKVLSGEMELSAFHAVVSACDAVTEQMASKTAQTKTDDLPETTPPNASVDGKGGDGKIPEKVDSPEQADAVAQELKKFC